MSDQTILAIGAHPDDIELGCGGSLSKLARSGAHVAALVFSNGRRGVLCDEDRAAETRAAMKTIGAAEVLIYDFEDTKLWANLNDLISVLEAIVRRLNPTRVYTMFEGDWHQDHR